MPAEDVLNSEPIFAHEADNRAGSNPSQIAVHDIPHSHASVPEVVEMHQDGSEAVMWRIALQSGQVAICGDVLAGTVGDGSGSALGTLSVFVRSPVDGVRQQEEDDTPRER